MTNTPLPQYVYRLAQKEFVSIPGSPWVYRISDSLRNLFKKLPLLGSIAQPKQGFASADNFRFIRFWWEVGYARIGLNFQDRQQAYKSKFKWFPCMKSGGRLWYTSQSEVVNWEREAKEMRTFDKAYIRNPEYHFREGAAYSSVSSSGLSFRWMPSGYICEHATNAIYSETRSWSHLALVGLFNSALANYIVGLNETINVNIEDLLRMPICQNKNLEPLVKLVEDNLRIRLFEDIHTELFLAFNFPGWWETSGLKPYNITNNISSVETQLNNVVFDLYQISSEDRHAIEAELASKPLGNDKEEQDEKKSEDEETDESAYVMTPQELAARWISYAVGVVLGRFHPGRANSLGSAIYRRSDFAIGSLPATDEAELDELVCPAEQFAYVDEQGGRHVFSAQVEQALQSLVLPDGIAVFDGGVQGTPGHPRYLPTLVEKALNLMLGEQAVREVIREATGGDSSTSQSASLQKFLEKDFFTGWHFKWYRKRPVYWPIQSSKRSYGFVIFHEKLTHDTLYTIQREPYLDTKRNAVALKMADLQTSLARATGTAAKKIEKELDDLRKLSDELAEFAKELEAITMGGYEPEPDWIDDGVILRMAPLWKVIPIWKSEPKKYWERLAAGDFDWSHIAMKYWPKRVRDKCKTNKSYAIAHDHEEWYQG